MFTLEKWSGQPKLVVGIDIGTSQTSVSFVYLKPHIIPTIEHVSDWPGQGGIHSKRTKIPTAIFYDRRGVCRSFGAETESHSTKVNAEKEGWIRVHSFKRHVHRLGDVVDTGSSTKEFELAGNITIKDVYAHWIGYLFEHFKKFFILLYNEDTWKRLSSTLHIIFAVPNGWFTQEHHLLLNAVKAVGAVKESGQVSFVPETEAAVHWALSKEFEMPTGTCFIVCDSGGSTTDIALYNVVQDSPLELQEAEGFPSACVEAGSALVDDAFEEMFSQMFSGEQAAEARQIFAEKKKNFDGTENLYRFKINLEGPTEYPAIEVAGDDITMIFDKEVSNITTEIDRLCAPNNRNNIKYIILFGDFGRSPYLQNQLKTKYEPAIQVIFASMKDANSKAVPAGSLVWYLTHGVVQRATRYAFGVEILDLYDPSNPEHLRRTPFKRASGTWVAGYWSEIIPFGTLLEDGHEYREQYWGEFDTVAELAVLPNYSTTIYTAHQDIAPTLKWLKDPQGNVNTGAKARCDVTADLSALRDKLVHMCGVNGPYWRLDYGIGITLGSTSPQGRLHWEDNGHQKHGPTTIIPAEF